MKTLEQMFGNIKEQVFRNDDVERVPQMTPDERREFMLKHVDRLLSVENTILPDGRRTDIVAAWFSDMFWTADEGRVPMSSNNPMLDKKVLKSLNDNDLKLCQFYLDAAGLCHDLFNHQAFDLTLLGVDGNSSLPLNPEFLAWLQQTPYQEIARHAVYTLQKELDKYLRRIHHFQAIDFICFGLDEGFNGDYIQPYDSEIPAQDYIQTLLKCVEPVVLHLADGDKMGLETDVIIMHDILQGDMKAGFNLKLMDMARQLKEALDNLYNQFDWSKRKKTGLPEKQPAMIRRQVTAVQEAFYDEILGIANGMLNEDSLQLSYLLDFAEYKCYGD